MTVFQNHFTKAHLFVFVGVWLSFTALTYWIAEHGIEQYDDRRLVILTTLGTILGPMTGAIARNCQSCCLANSLGLPSLTCRSSWSGCWRSCWASSVAGIGCETSGSALCTCWRF